MNKTRIEIVDLLGLVFVLWGIMGIGCCSYAIWIRSLMTVDGTIIRSIKQCSQDKNNQCSSTYNIYTVRLRQSGEEVQYEGGTEGAASLQNNLSVGTQIHKIKGQLTYEINGQSIDNFPLPIYLTSITLSGASLIGGATVLVLRSREKTKET